MPSRHMFWAAGLGTLLGAAPVFAQSGTGDKAGAPSKAADTKPGDAGKKPPDQAAKPPPKPEDKSGLGDAALTGANAPSSPPPKTEITLPAVAPASTPPMEPFPPPSPRAEPVKPETEDFWQSSRPRAGEIELGYFVGLLNPSDRHNFHSRTLPQQDIKLGPFFGTRIGYFPLEVLGAELEAGIAPTSTADHRGAQVWTARGHLVAQLPLSRLAPFLVLGGGRMGVFSNALGNDADPLLHFGLGAKFALSDVVLARFDFRDNLTQKAGAGDGALTHSLELTFGISVRIPTVGESAAEPPAPPRAMPVEPGFESAPLAADPFGPEPKPPETKPPQTKPPEAKPLEPPAKQP